jgi:hypothetical protein
MSVLIKKHKDYGAKNIADAPGGALNGLRVGRKGETLVEELLTGGRTVEVKRDRKWWITNNLYIEVECWFNKSKSWEPSGLSVTEAAYWAFVLEQSNCYSANSYTKEGCVRTWQGNLLRSTT